MNRNQPASVRPWHQTNWDWRAALNFLGGGTGTGLLIAAAFAGGAAYAGLALGALACVAFGLFWVWMEIGKPWRAINVVFHPQTSWMTRESLVAGPLFVVAIAAAWYGALWLVAGAALLAALFLYCQARILKASKGIPAWREPAIVPLVIATGLAEGTGLAIVALVATGNLATRWLIAALVVVLIVRDLMWRQYRRALARGGAPKGALDVLAGIDLPFSLVGNWGPAALLLAAIPDYAAANTLALIAGIAALGAGWFLKFTIVARAAFNQGFALPALPIRGQGKRVAGTKPGWEKPAQG
ncbi:MAG: phenylacetyl-CoA:acceptor oxidoreductase [Betaproteobacteria bacterium]|jgi:phenylacetyl-CoA:acceptor oxidoreductase subunit 2|nr:phenylacetyl-CoA:acceptor oxidoreductase [Betaproteobacteria bacterium]